MAKKQTRRSISVSRTTYERLKAFCEANSISMSQLVETRVNDFLGDGPAPAVTVVPHHAPSSFGAPRPAATPSPVKHEPRPISAVRPVEPRPVIQPVPMTSVAARYAIDPPPPIIKPRQQEAAPAPAEKRPDQIFTF